MTPRPAMAIPLRVAVAERTEQYLAAVPRADGSGHHQPPHLRVVLHGGAGGLDIDHHVGPQGGW